MAEIFSHDTFSDNMTVDAYAETGTVQVTLAEFGLDSLSHTLTLSEAIALSNALSKFLGDF